MRYIAPNLEEVGAAEEIVLGGFGEGDDNGVDITDRPPVMTLGLDD